MEDFLPELWKSVEGATVSELALIARRLTLALGEKASDAIANV